MTNITKVLLASSIALQSIAFIILKLGSEFQLSIQLIFFGAALCVMLFRAYVWQKVLVDAQLSIVYPFTLITQVLLFLYGIFIFNEDFNLQQVIGLTVVCMGLYIVYKK
jgi:multidrug transporter EmrE-like cation transporter